MSILLSDPLVALIWGWGIGIRGQKWPQITHSLTNRALNEHFLLFWGFGQFSCIQTWSLCPVCEMEITEFLVNSFVLMNLYSLSKGNVNLSNWSGQYFWLFVGCKVIFCNFGLCIIYKMDLEDILFGLTFEIFTNISKSYFIKSSSLDGNCWLV